MGSLLRLLYDRCADDYEVKRILHDFHEKIQLNSNGEGYGLSVPMREGAGGNEVSPY